MPFDSAPILRPSLRAGDSAPIPGPSLRERVNRRSTSVRTAWLAAGLLAAATAAGVLAQAPERLDHALRAIYERDEFTAESVGPTAWLDGGRRYTSVGRGEKRELVAYDTATG